jgi:hypothetical protein
MKLYLSCSIWGPRKSRDGGASLLLVDFDRRKVLCRLDRDLSPGATRGFAGLTYDDKWLYAARGVNDHCDEIVVADKESLRPVRTIALPECHDIHQIDAFAGLLWVTNTNYNEIVAIEPETGRIVGRRKLFPDVLEERKLTASVGKTDGDHRKRPHINSIMVSDGLVQVGLFGNDRGNFHGSQLLGLPWEKCGDGSVRFHSPDPLPVNGYRYPHNVHLRGNGVVLGCNSAEGELWYGERKLKLAGWPRGVAVTESDFYVAISSHSYGLSKSSRRNGATELNGTIVRVDRATLKVRDRYEFNKLGQFYDVRLADEKDLGMSLYAHLDSSPPRAATRSLFSECFRALAIPRQVLRGLWAANTRKAS